MRFYIQTDLNKMKLFSGAMRIFGMREIRHNNGEAPIYSRKTATRPVGLLLAGAALVVIVAWAVWKALT